ncbi:hypothetical protein DBR17_06365, partial [Sphingomonas sp. HMWF008]
MLGVAAIGLSVPVSAAQADALQAKIVATARATPTARYAFRRTLTVERSGAAAKTYVEQFDPRRAAADRWTLVSVDGRAPSAKDIASSRKTKRGPTPSYAQVADWFGAAATRSEVKGGVLYRFARLPKGMLKIGSHDASADTQAEALVNTSGAVPFVEHVRMVSNKSFSVMLVASLKSIGSGLIDPKEEDGCECDGSEEDVCAS